MAQVFIGQEVYFNRTLGGDRDNRDFSGDVATRIENGERNSYEHSLPEQSQTVEYRLEKLYE
jgi:hypothetical protein